MKNVPGLALCAALLAGCAAPDASRVALVAPIPVAYEYVIDAAPNIALHRAFNANGKTYLEFLDARRMNPVVTGLDGVPLMYAWTENYVVLDGVYDNLTVTTPHGVAHVYARSEPPPARAAAPTPARAAEFGVQPQRVVQIMPDNYGFEQLPPTGDAIAPERMSVPAGETFAAAISGSQADQLVASSREASRVVISATVPTRSKTSDARAHARMAEARQFLIENGVPAHKIYVSRVTASAARASHVDFLISN